MGIVYLKGNGSFVRKPLDEKTLNKVAEILGIPKGDIPDTGSIYIYHGKKGGKKPSPSGGGKT